MKEAQNDDLAALRAARASGGDQDDVRRNSPLRMISLVRLEKQIQLGLACGRLPDEAMQMLAGLRRIRYVLVYPPQGQKGAREQKAPGGHPVPFSSN